MAINNTNISTAAYQQEYSVFNNGRADISPYTDTKSITSKLVCVDTTYNMHITQITPDEEIKRQVAYKLIEHMLSNNLIEFTRQKSTYSDDIVIKAYLYVTNREETRLIRTLNKGNNYV